MMNKRDEDIVEVIFHVLAVSGLYLFLCPAIFMWIWNWQFGEIYTFTYWPAFWLAIALGFLRAKYEPKDET